MIPPIRAVLTDDNPAPQTKPSIYGEAPRVGRGSMVTIIEVEWSTGWPASGHVTAVDEWGQLVRLNIRDVRVLLPEEGESGQQAHNPDERTSVYPGEW